MTGRPNQGIRDERDMGGPSCKVNKGQEGEEHASSIQYIGESVAVI
jgi:hypothetical protein